MVGWCPRPFLDTLYDYVDFLNGGPIATPPASGPGEKVAIIGAGAAGLVAGYELLGAGFDPVIFEATDRIGGRCWTVDMGAGALAEMGAMRVPASHQTVWHYVDRFKLPSAPFPDPGEVRTTLYYKNKSPLTWMPPENGQPNPPPGPFAKINDDFGMLVGPYVSSFAPAWSTFQHGETDPKHTRLHQLWQMALNRNSANSFYSAVRSGTLWNDDEMEAFGALGLGSGGFGPMFPIDYVSALRYVLEQHNLGLKYLQDGFGAFMERFLETPPPGADETLWRRVRLGTPVQSIDYVDGRPVLQFTDGRSESFGAVIVATSTRSADVLGMTLPTQSGALLLEDGPAQALRDLHMTSASKLFIRTKSKFWLESPHLPQMILTDELPRSTYCLDYAGTDSGVVLVTYTWEDDSATVTSMPAEALFDRCLRVLEIAAPEFARHLHPVGDPLKIDWTNERYFHGAFQLPQPGQEPLIQSAYYQFQSSAEQKRDKGIYLAGDGISFQGGWVEGALRTGVNAACAAAVRVGGKVRADSPLTQSPTLYSYTGS